jgi:hypothetical protein
MGAGREKKFRLKAFWELRNDFAFQEGVRLVFGFRLCQG